MSSSPVPNQFSEAPVMLQVEGLSKQYRLGKIGTGTLSHDLNRWWHRFLGKEDPYIKIGDNNDRSVKGTSQYVWALKDINFEVKQGEVLGIIGKNGAGKSTLLKILSRVTSPTTGSVKSAGRIASLLEVGTGFHPEMTGRENIYLNGAILGMTKKEIASKLDEIIAFSGCERYIDTPTKRYSSGMTVRLAFAVAAHLDPEILVVDEVLAVGDAEFQKKAIGKMHEISKGGGRTVLFVSHNMAAVKNLCSRGILIEKGEVVYQGAIDEVVNTYLQNEETSHSKLFINNDSTSTSHKVEKFEITSEITTGATFAFEADIFSEINQSVEFSVGFRLSDSSPILQLYSGHVGELFSMKKGKNRLKGSIEHLPLISGSYHVTLWLGSKGICFDFHKTALNILVREGAIKHGGPISSKNGYPVIYKSNWEVI
ncbi:MAG: ABC transporter ATP-binding protein [Flavobacterium sp.]